MLTNNTSTLTISVIGLGKIGLPLAVQFASKGFQVFGADIDQRVVDLVNNGLTPFPGEEDLDWKLKEVVRSGLLVASLDTKDVVSKSNVVVVVVPLFVDEQGIPDFRAMDGATELIGFGLKHGTLVSYETTLPIGTTRNRFTPNLEKFSNLRADEDFYVVFSPERVLTGRVFQDLSKYPKLVGGISPESEARGIAFYSQVLDFQERSDLPIKNGVWSMGSSEASEFAKLAETTYRDVNIGLANQYALFAQEIGVDVHKIIRASNSQPFSHIHQPGIAVGGHCIPIYPQMYLWRDSSATIVRSAREANELMPIKCIEWLERKHGSLSGQRVVVLGASYRGGVKETAFSGAFRLVQTLEKYGSIVVVHDPMYTDSELENLGFRSFNFDSPVDIVVVQADHAMYNHLTKEDFPGVRAVFDGRGILNEFNWQGVDFCLIGRG